MAWILPPKLPKIAMHEDVRLITPGILMSASDLRYLDSSSLGFRFVELETPMKDSVLRSFGFQC